MNVVAKSTYQKKKECGGKKCFDGSLGTAYHIWTLGGWNDKMAALEISMLH